MAKVEFIIPVVNCSMAWARNPDRSAWVTNLSQVAEPEGLTRDDTFLNLSVSGTTIHSVWRAAGGPSESYRSSIFYRRSKNNGAAWQAPVSLYQASDQNEINGLTEGNGPILCASGKHVHVVLARSVPGWHYEALYLHSGNSGASFEPARILFRGNDAWGIQHPRLACQGTNVSIGFTHYYGPPQQVVTLNSNDNGATFSQTIAASSSDNDGIMFWDIKRNGRFLYLLHAENNGWPNYETFLSIAVSMDSGQTFINHRLSTPDVNGQHHAYQAQDLYYQPHLALSGSTVYALWAQNDLGKDNDDGKAIYMAKSINYGKTFGHPLKVSDGVEGKQIAQGLETVAAKGNHLYLMFPTRDGRVLLRHSNDKGATFSTGMDISRGVGGWWSQLAIDPRDGTGATVHALTNISYSVTRDGGKTFSTPLQSFPYDLTWERPKLAIGAYSTALAGGIGSFHDVPLCGGGCDRDAMLRRLTPAPAPVGTGMGLTLKTIHEPFAGRYDNMQVAHGPSLDFKGAMTLEMWVKPWSLGATTGTTSEETPFLFKDAQLSTSRSYWQPAYALSTVDYYGKRRVWAEIATTTGRYSLAGDPAKQPRSLLPFRTWSHLALSYDANLPADNLKLFRNGILVAKGNASGEIAAGFGNLFVGRYGYSVVDEVRLWSRALTQQEIQAGMNIPLTGGESGLEAYYPLEKTTKDQTGHGNDGLRMYRESFTAGKM